MAEEVIIQKSAEFPIIRHHDDPVPASANCTLHTHLCHFILVDYNVILSMAIN